MVSTSPDAKKKRLSSLQLGVIIVLALSILFGLIGVLSFPRLAERALHEQLTRVEERVGLSIEVGSVETLGLSGIRLENLLFELPEGTASLGSIQEIELSVSVFDALRGRPVLTAATLRGLEFTIHRQSDGTTTLDDLLASLSGPEETSSQTDSSPRPPAIDSGERTRRLLRHFGGVYPELLVQGLVVHFTHQDPAEPWPLHELRMDSFTLSPGPEASFTSTIDLDGVRNNYLRLPDQILLSGTLAIPIERSDLDLQFSPQIRFANLPQAPFTEFSLQRLVIENGESLRLYAPTLDSRFSELTHPLGSADEVMVHFDGLPTSLQDLSLLEMEVQGLRLFLDFNHRGASNVGELYALARQPAASGVHTRARQIAAAIAAESRDSDDDDDHSPSDDDPLASAPSSGLRSLPIRELLTGLIPQHTRFNDFRLVVEDQREHPSLTSAATSFEIAGESIDLRHRPIQGLLEGKMRFQLLADEEKGQVDVDLAIPYRRGDWNAKIDIDALQLARFSQLGGPRVARKIQGGLITASFEVSNQGGGDQRTLFEGLFAARDVRLHFTSFAENPIVVDSTSLNLKGYYDPRLRLPVPELIQSGSSVQHHDGDGADDDELNLNLPIDDSDDVVAQDAPPPPNQGALVIEEATARLADVEASFRLSLFGVEGLRMPNRASLKVELPETPITSIVEAIPTALLGPFEGTRFQGSIAWDFHLEVPFYEASHMRWQANPRLSNDFDVLFLPDPVNVFKLTEAFDHTIRDEWTTTSFGRERKFIYERPVQIPAMTPTPATWLIENAGLELDRIDRIRRRRDWPKVPTWDPFDRSHGLTREVLESPEYWLSRHALSQAAPSPFHDPDPSPRARSFQERASPGGPGFWQSLTDTIAPAAPAFDPYNHDQVVLYEKPDPPRFQQPEIQINTERYGSYIFVPIHHISPYLPRAIMTTEDTSFFTHKGFNFLAIRHSVQANINAGRFVRGASTISMQLAKNLFLDRSRVLSRKLQEVALVWLMESVAEIPKERLLEIYLNIIEFGPGVYGINDASIHYFGKRPDELTISEVAWLVSIVPSPKRHHIHYERGEIPQWFFRRMSRYIRAMYNRERITEEEMLAAFEDHPHFYIPEDGEPVLIRFAPLEEETIEEAPRVEGADPPLDSGPSDAPLNP